MPTAAKLRHYTVDEYLALERPAERKHEYRDGRIVMMPGVRRAHMLVNMNLAACLHIRVYEAGCEVYTGDMRVCVEEDGLYTYPDLSVVCGEPRFRDDHVDNLLNPCLIAEILSPSTEVYDRGEKLDRYRRLGTLRDCLLIAQDRAQVEHWARRDEGWELTRYTDLGDVVRLDSVGCEVPLSAIYARVPRIDEGAGG